MMKPTVRALARGRRFGHGNPHRRFAVALMILVASMAMACAETDEPGTPGALSLSWTAGPEASCESAGIEQVEIRLVKGDERQLLGRYGCDTGNAFIDAVSPGRYTLELSGLNADGIATFESVVPSVRIGEGEHLSLGTVRLSARPASVEVSWFFSNGRLCSQNLVESIRVKVYDDELYDVSESEFPCDAGFGRLEPLPAGDYVLEVVALPVGDDDPANARARRVVEIEVERGEDLLIEISLNDVVP